MKIAVFHNLPTGGAYRVVYEEVKYLSRNNIVDVFELKNSNKQFLDIGKFANNIYSYDFEIKSNLFGFLRRLHKDILNFVVLSYIHRKIAKKINKGNYNVALIHADKYTQAPYLLRYLNIPKIYYAEEHLRLIYEKEFEFRDNVGLLKRYYELITRKIRKIIDRKNITYSDSILVNSEFTKVNIKKSYGMESTVCYPGVDTAIFKPTEVSRRKYILYFGAKEYCDDYDMVNIIKKTTDNIFGIKMREIRQGVNKIKLKDNDLAKIYSNALLTICTSKNEPFGLIALESMSCSTPVLAVNEGGYRETVLHGKCGYLLKRDSRDFVKKIEYLLKNRNSLERIGRNARRYVKQNWQWRRHIQILEKELTKFSKFK